MVASPVLRLIATLALTALVGTLSACTSEGGDPIAQGGEPITEQESVPESTHPLAGQGSRIEPVDPPADPNSRSETDAAWADLLLAIEVPVATYTKETVLDSRITGEQSTVMEGEIDLEARLIRDEMTVMDMRIRTIRSDSAVYLRTDTPTGPCGGDWVEIDAFTMAQSGFVVDPEDMLSFDLTSILSDVDPPTSSTSGIDGTTTFEVEVPGTVGPANSALHRADPGQLEELEASRNTMHVTLWSDDSVSATLDATTSVAFLLGSAAPDDLTFTVDWQFGPQDSVGPLVEPVGAPKISDC